MNQSLLANKWTQFERTVDNSSLAISKSNPGNQPNVKNVNDFVGHLESYD